MHSDQEIPLPVLSSLAFWMLSSFGSDYGKIELFLQPPQDTKWWLGVTLTRVTNRSAFPHFFCPHTFQLLADKTIEVDNVSSQLRLP